MEKRQPHRTMDEKPIPRKEMNIVLASLIVTFGGLFLLIWTGASALGIIRYRRTNTPYFVIWFLSLVAAGIVWAFYTQWLKEVFG